MHISVAIKVIDKRSISTSQIESTLKEISIMRRIDHPNVVKLYNYINTKDMAFLVIEYVSGGELFNQIVKLTYFSENLARHIIIQVVKAVDYLHSEVGVVHRDIKPENLLFETIDFFPTEGPQKRRRSDDASKLDEGEFRQNIGGGTVGKIKLADFGLSKVLWDSNTKTPCGTASYTAPEIVRDESYSKSVDMWAIGCVLYTLLCGFPPFYDSDPKVLTQKVSRGEYTFLSPWWDEISKEAKDLVSHLLTVDPVKRYSPDDVLNHPWILENSQPTAPAHDAPMYQTKSESVLRFEEVIPTHPSSGYLSPRAEALKFALDTGISIQRTATPLRRILDENEYFDESDDESDDEDESDEDDEDDDDDAKDSEDDEKDGEDSYTYTHGPVYAKSPVLKRFHDKTLPVTPYLTRMAQEKSKESMAEQKKKEVSASSNSTFKEMEGFTLRFDGNTLLNRRKMSGSVACGSHLGNH